MTEKPVVRVALAGDTMLGRGVADRIACSRRPPFSGDVVAAAAEADLFIVNLECCISARGARWPAPGKPFFFRAPPVAAELLAQIGVDCVTLANNHALDYGPQALLDTLEHLRAAGIACVGAGPDETIARAPHRVRVRDLWLALLGASDHPSGYAAGRQRPGIAYADLRTDPSGGWLGAAVADAHAHSPIVIANVHWGPNMTTRPCPYVRRAAEALVAAGATLISGHSAHVFQGATRRVLYDLGDFVDDYRLDPRLRNDLGLLFLVDLDARGIRRLEAIPLKLDHCHTRLASQPERQWITRRFTAACGELGIEVAEDHGRLIANFST
jgi:poly-gamma-glutamate capsule biosynthesis protein CapA/YwtB (metallophosphatase superfamily)